MLLYIIMGMMRYFRNHFMMAISSPIHTGSQKKKMTIPTLPLEPALLRFNIKDKFMSIFLETGKKNYGGSETLPTSINREESPKAREESPPPAKKTKA